MALYLMGSAASFKTFSLDEQAELLIKGSLLDRFLACMKPASITSRPLRAGVFFWAIAKIQLIFGQFRILRRFIDLIGFSAGSPDSGLLAT
ncbi:MAG: hypothetical protein BM559_07760 [Roseobacter sp. MedPE-SWchi]|nr:MAG: hypothetical protein BM559_07760 [Roseobacter sp. MedPE-SWchi]